MSERFFRSNRSQYPHPVCSELENSGARVVVGDCSITEHWRYQTGKTVQVHAKHNKHIEDGRMVLGVCGHGSIPLGHSENVTRSGLQQQITTISVTRIKHTIFEQLLQVHSPLQHFDVTADSETFRYFKLLKRQRHRLL